MSYATPNETPDPRMDSPTPEETPLTEAHLFGARGGDCVTEVKAVTRANFSRRLERERNNLHAHAERLAEALEASRKEIIDLAVTGTNRLLDAGVDCDAPVCTYAPILMRLESSQALTLYRAEHPKK